MDPIKTKRKTPEALIQEAVTEMLEKREWLVEPTFGSLYQFGFPDLYCAHSSYGTRWLEIKNPYSYSFTPAQTKKFPAFHAKHVGIWILIDSTEDEYEKLFKPANWWSFCGRHSVYGYRCQVLENHGIKMPSDGLTGDWKID